MSGPTAGGVSGLSGGSGPDPSGEVNDLGLLSNEELAAQLHANFVNSVLPNPLTDSDDAVEGFLEAGQRVIATLRARGVSDEQIEAMLVATAPTARPGAFTLGGSPAPDDIANIVSTVPIDAPANFTPYVPDTSFETTGIEDLPPAPEPPVQDYYHDQPVPPSFVPPEAGASADSLLQQLGWKIDPELWAKAQERWQWPGPASATPSGPSAASESPTPAPAASESSPPADFQPAENEVLGTTTSTPLAADASPPNQSYYHDRPVGPGNEPPPDGADLVIGDITGITDGDGGAQPAMAYDPGDPRAVPGFEYAEDEVLGTTTSTPADEVVVPTEYAPDLTDAGSSPPPPSMQIGNPDEKALDAAARFLRSDSLDEFLTPADDLTTASPLQTSPPAAADPPVMVPTEYAPDLTTPADDNFEATGIEDLPPSPSPAEQPAAAPDAQPPPARGLSEEEERTIAHRLDTDLSSDDGATRTSGAPAGEDLTTIPPPESVPAEDPPIVVPTEYAPDLTVPGGNGTDSTIGEVSSTSPSGKRPAVIIGAAVVVAAAVAISLALSGGSSAPKPVSHAASVSPAKSSSATPSPATPSQGASAAATTVITTNDFGVPTNGNCSSYPITYTFAVQNPPSAGFKSVTVVFTGAGLPTSPQTFPLDASGTTPDEHVTATGCGTWKAKVTAVDGVPLSAAAESASESVDRAGG